MARDGEADVDDGPHNDGEEGFGGKIESHGNSASDPSDLRLVLPKFPKRDGAAPALQEPQRSNEHTTKPTQTTS
ncbi:hypothetical protein GGTG_09610 [Gaeumannomyces tritici R3-111a-1]|uniref:Uncharacterized protein n=1 Tax=Gaeumannomyces tritici (strain R3-111a-1) TaxID=644352 RepID=J3P7X0_GAET3|nr:hypothetical protein GGTG_09610 [Gaeumannomyces tritici R3-111a-1]EJT72753.1 hypothetical protein GGTG_09610 [Gaeumannomyces tritici R3-111a-1]